MAILKVMSKYSWNLGSWLTVNQESSWSTTPV